MSDFRINFGLVLLILLKILVTQAKDIKHDFTTSATPTTTLQRTLVGDSGNTDTNKEGLAKRETKAADQTISNTVASKSYDPPPEFYRGPGSTGALQPGATPYYNGNNKLSGGFISKPIAFPGTDINNNHGPPDNGVQLANSYNAWQNQRNKTAFFGSLLNKTGLQDRISVGHYGNPLHDSRPYSGTQHHSGVEYIPSGGSHHYSSSHSGGGYAYEGRPYTVTHPHVEYGHPSHTAGTYYAAGGGGEGIPFDVYGTTGGSKGHYGSSGGDYAYPYSDMMHETAAHKTFPDLSHKALLAKSFLIPLASAAVLGIAAALVSNPLLLQLGTVSGVAAPGSVLGKRKRRSISSTTPKEKPANAPSVAASMDTHPYRGHHRRFVVRT
ncbi:uncharacterized protein LOC106081127 [Stomoxys calcitrans]|uniref:uncharacterized protein LOC106081127 n=1 Tax=Stomoxys calcitrans TaxID=35570 RepID=UPI0027E27806|nr:uncharacterized protein LOC106081127 [Stomoxys calcitrans]